jgi:pyruvate,water dikinase
MSGAEYIDRYGHRGPHESELYAPMPGEDPDWLEKRLADFTQSGVDVEALITRQHALSSAAWQRFQERFPDKYPTFHRRMQQVAAAAQKREAFRSEVIRVSQLTRQFLLKVGSVTGIHDSVFFLTVDEMTALLAGDRSALSAVPARKDMYQRQCALPPYPAIIYGRFDPFQWAADPNRRSDFFDARQTRSTVIPHTIQGFPGAAGFAEGIVRRIDRVEDGCQILPGEILVTTTTNIGWTILFPRLAAIITDVGAPLSHAAIVARELGIPAVVGCGNATMLLKTGDRVRVDGGAGTVALMR